MSAHLAQPNYKASAKEFLSSFASKASFSVSDASVTSLAAVPSLLEVIAKLSTTLLSFVSVVTITQTLDSARRSVSRENIISAFIEDSEHAGTRVLSAILAFPSVSVLVTKSISRRPVRA
jgi:hypothetical protein